MVKRLYLIEYELLVNAYGGNPHKEHRVETFLNNERDEFIERYLELKDLFYIEDIIVSYAETKIIENMDNVINAI